MFLASYFVRKGDSYEWKARNVAHSLWCVQQAIYCPVAGFRCHRLGVLYPVHERLGGRAGRDVTPRHHH